MSKFILNEIAIIFCVFVCIACKSKSSVSTEDNELNAMRKKVNEWIEINDYQAAIFYRKNDHEDFVETNSIGPHVTSLRRYIDAKSFELFKDEKEIEGVVAILSNIHNQANSGELSVHFRSVIDGNVELVSGGNELVVKESLFKDAMIARPTAQNN